VENKGGITVLIPNRWPSKNSWRVSIQGIEEHRFWGKEASEYVPLRTSTVYHTSGSNMLAISRPDYRICKLDFKVGYGLSREKCITSVLRKHVQGTAVHWLPRRNLVATYLQMSLRRLKLVLTNSVRTSLYCAMSVCTPHALLV